MSFIVYQAKYDIHMKARAANSDESNCELDEYMPVSTRFLEPLAPFHVIALTGTLIS